MTDSPRQETVALKADRADVVMPSGGDARLELFNRAGYVGFAHLNVRVAPDALDELGGSALRVGRAEREIEDCRFVHDSIISRESSDHESTCPICGRVWTITMWDDCLVPACGCYGDDVSAPIVPCESCGLAHAWKCRARD